MRRVRAALTYAAAVVALCAAPAMGAPGAVSWEMPVPDGPPGLTPLDPGVRVLPAVLGPDGSTYVALGVRGGSLTVYRADPGATSVVAVHSEPYVEGTRLVSGGPGFVLAHVPPADPSDVVAYDRDGGSPKVLSHCAGDSCTRCFSWSGAEPLNTYHSVPDLNVAADATDALIIPTCHDGPGAPAVTDIATGAVTPVAFNEAFYPLSGYQIAGDWISQGDQTVDWRTGAAQPANGDVDSHAYALLDDGSLIYTRTGPGRTSAVYRTAPGLSAPALLPVSGSVLGATGDRILVGRGARGIELDTTDGALLGATTATGSPAFDGTRVVWSGYGCFEARLDIWAVGQSPASGPAGCLPPSLGPVRVGRTISIHASCPAGNGCFADASPLTLRPDAQAVTLRGGTAGWFRLASHVSAARCRAVRRGRYLPVAVRWLNASRSTRHLAVRVTGRCPRAA